MNSASSKSVSSSAKVLEIHLRSRSSRLTKKFHFAGVLFVGILSLKARSIVLFGVVDAVAELLNVVVVLIGSDVTMFCLFLNLKLGREEKLCNFKISNSSIRNK